ncbi:MAG: Hsp70 family protein [Planctomycetales bacterium]|nr:Hsp70 family protein [Planctomycetales bacterium]
MSITLGIDFGAERLAVAACDGERLLLEGVLPASGLYLDRSQAIVGPARTAAHHPARVATLVKPMLGQCNEMVLDDRTWRPEALAALMLRGAREWAEAALRQSGVAVKGEPGQMIDAVGITVSASFDAVQRRALQVAANAAALPRPMLIGDAAAAIAAWLESRSDAGAETLLVCDLGSACCDLAFVSVEGRSAQVIAQQGETWGASTWDSLVLERIAEEIERELGATPLGPLTEKLWRRANLALASRLRRRLDDGEMADWETRFEDQLFRGWLFAHQLEEMVDPMIDWMEGQVDHVLAGRRPQSLLFTGGGSRMPHVRGRIARVAGARDMSPSDDCHNARGAALMASRRIANAATVVDAAPCSLGIFTVDRKSKKAVNKIVLEAGTPLPCQRNLKLGQIGDTKVNVKILQGELLAAEDNRLVGECQLDPAICGSAIVQLKLGYDLDGALDVRLQRGEETPVPLELSHEETLADESVQRLRREVQRIEVSALIPTLEA